MGRRQRPSREQLTQDVRFAQRHGSLTSGRGRRALNAYLQGAQDDEIISLIYDEIDPLRSREAWGTLCPLAVPKGGARGAIEVGSATNGTPVRLSPRELCEHLCIAGSSGSGKTTFLLFLLLQLCPLVPGVWATDNYKSGPLRHLRAPLAKLGMDWIVLRARDLRLNPLQADGDPGTHLSIVTDQLQSVLGLPSRARRILTASVYELYDQAGIWAGQRDEWPHLFQLFEHVRAKQGENAAAKDALLDRLGSLLLQLTPAVGAYRRAWSPTDLSRLKLCFELRDASESVKDLHLQYLFSTVMYHRLATAPPNAPLDFFVALDDAQRLLARGAGEGRDVAPLEEVAALIRSTGTALCPLVQSLEGVSKGLLANLSTKVMTRLSTHDDYARMGAHMGLSREELDWARLHLKPGLAIVQRSQGEDRRPFLLHVPHVDLPPIVTDQDVAESAKSLAHLPVIPCEQYRNWTPIARIEVNAHTTTQQPPSPLPQTLSDPEARYLEAVLHSPGLPSSRYLRLARIGSKNARSIRMRLVALGYLREHSVTTGRRGRPSIVLEPTERGRDALSAHSGAKGGI